MIVIVMTFFLTLSSLIVSIFTIEKYIRTYLLVFIPLSIIWLQLYISSKMINYFCRLVLGSEIKDYTSSIFLMKKEVLKYGVPIAYGHGEFFIEFLYKVKKNGMKICELPYVQPPDQEGSKTASSIEQINEAPKAKVA